MLLIGAQLLLEGGRPSAPTATAALCGLGAWVLALRSAPARRSREAMERTSTALRLLPLGVALLAGTATWHLSSEGVYTRRSLIAWGLTIACWMWAFMPLRMRDGGQWRWSRDRARTRGWTAVAVLAVVAAGTFFRFHHLPQTPQEPTSDHAEKLLDIADIRAGIHPVFFPRNTGREPLQFYVSAALVDGGMAPTFSTLKIGTAFVGALGIVGVLLLAWELAGRGAGLVAAALFSVAEWPVSLARDGLRHGYAVSGAAFALWLLFRYLRTRSHRDLVLCGAVLGIGLHGYTAFRIVPAFAAVIVTAAAINRGRRMLVDAGILAATIAVTTLPLLRYAVDHPDRVWYRTIRRVGGAEAPVGGLVDVGALFVSNLGNAALAFNVKGDSSSVALVRYEPFLDVVTGAAFLAGLLILGQRLLQGADVRVLALAAALPVLTLASVLNFAFPHENPSAARMAPVAPVVYSIAGFALAHVLTRLSAIPHRLPRRAAMTLLVSGALGLAAADNYSRYFRDFHRQYRAFIPNTSEAVAAIESLDVPRERVYMLPFDHWLDPRNVGVALGEIGWASTNVVGADQTLPVANGCSLVFLLNQADATGRSRMLQAYSSGTYRRVASAVEKDFGLFVVPPSSLPLGESVPDTAAC